MKKLLSIICSFLFVFIAYSHEASAVTCKDMDSNHCNSYNGTGGCRTWKENAQCSAGMPTGTKRCGCHETLPGYYMNGSLDVMQCPKGKYCPGNVGAGGDYTCPSGTQTCQARSQSQSQCVSSCGSSSGLTTCPGASDPVEVYGSCPTVCGGKCVKCEQPDTKAVGYYCTGCAGGCSFRVSDYTCHPIDCQSGKPSSTTPDGIENCKSTSICWKNNATAYYCNQCKDDYTLTSSGCVKSCEAGYFLAGGACQICPVNMYCPKGSTSPTHCNAVHYGYVTDGTGAKASSDCHEATPVCQPGQYLDGNTCKPCLAGSFTSTEGATACIPCIPGYWSEQGSSSCTKVNCAQFNPQHGRCVLCTHYGCDELECDENYEANYLTKTCESSSTVQSCMPPFVFDENQKCCIIPPPSEQG